MYFCVSFFLLWNCCGPTADGAGYMPGLTLPGFQPPSVSIADYVGNWNVRFQYGLPYLVYALAFTLLGCIAAVQVVRRFGKLASHAVPASMAVALVFLLAAPAFSDMGHLLKFWWTPRWFAWDLGAYWTIRPLLFVFFPLSVLSGFVALGAKRIGA
jgi:hypothetical protein